MLKKFAPFIAIALGSLVSLGAVYWYQVHWLYQVGLPLDDSYIHLQYAKNMIEDGWFVYSWGQAATPGDTSPLWVLLIAAAGSVYDNLTYVSLFLGGIFYVLTGMAAYFLGLRFFASRNFALAYGLVVIFTGRLLWSAASGMEGTLFSFLCLLGALCYLRGREAGRFSLLAAAVFGLGANARPEGNLLFLLALADWILLQKILREKKLRLSSIPWLGGIVFAILAMPYPLFSLAATGHLTPNTFRVSKLAFSWSRRPEYLKLVLQFLYHDNLLLHPALPLGVWLFPAQAILGSERMRKNFLLWLWPLGYLAASLCFTPIQYHFQRYLIPVLPFFVLVSFCGWEWVLEKLKEFWHPKIQRVVSYALSAVLVGWAAFITLYGWPALTALCVKNINEMQVKIGYWVKNNTRPDDLIAANDIGAIFYLSQRPALDLVGLVNPELLDKVQGLKISNSRRDQLTLDYLKERRPAYLIVFPNWFPSLVANGQYFRPVYSIVLTDNIICPADEMKVYKCSWPEK